MVENVLVLAFSVPWGFFVPCFLERDKFFKNSGVGKDG